MSYLEQFYERTLLWLERYGPRIVVAILVLLVAQLLLRRIRRWIKTLFDKSHIDPSARTFLPNFIITVLQVVLFIVLMQILGVKLTLLASVVAGLSVAAGLALSGTLQNFASGVLVLLLRPYKVGDNIITQGQEGTVNSIQLFYTVIVTIDNKTVIVPNSKLSNEIIFNLSRQGRRRLDMELRLKYDQDYSVIKERIKQAFAGMESVLDEPPLRIGISKLEPDSYIITINAWIPSQRFEDGKFLVNEKLMSELSDTGIFIKPA